MNVNDIYNSESKWIKAQDLPQGKEVPVVISGFEIVELDNRKKVALQFQGKDKGLVLNKTNAGAISSAFGGDCTTWAGKTIFLHSTKVDFSGQMVDAVRVRPQLETAMDDEDIPF